MKWRVLMVAAVIFTSAIVEAQRLPPGIRRGREPVAINNLS
jgi:hypothetical protein